MEDFHGGIRKRLQSAVLARNSKPLNKHGVATGTLWRAFLLLTSRWRSAAIRDGVYGPKQDLSKEEWLQYVSKNEAEVQ